MIKQLNNFLSYQEIRMLIRHFVFKEDLEKEKLQKVIDKLIREMSYDIRKYSHSAKAKSLRLTTADIEKNIWKHYIREQIEKGQTTGELSKKVDKPLEFINSFF